MTEAQREVPESLFPLFGFEHIEEIKRSLSGPLEEYFLKIPKIITPKVVIWHESSKSKFMTFYTQYIQLLEKNLGRSLILFQSIIL